MNTPTKPNLLQYIGYCYGRRLPDSMRDWVREDLTGKGATIRMMVRVFIPAFLLHGAVLVHSDDARRAPVHDAADPDPVRVLLTRAE